MNCLLNKSNGILSVQAISPSFTLTSSKSDLLLLTEKMSWASGGFSV